MDAGRASHTQTRYANSLRGRSAGAGAGCPRAGGPRLECALRRQGSTRWCRSYHSSSAARTCRQDGRDPQAVLRHSQLAYEVCELRTRLRCITKTSPARYAQLVSSSAAACVSCLDMQSTLQHNISCRVHAAYSNTYCLKWRGIKRRSATMSISRVQDAHCGANLTDLIRRKGRHVLQVRNALASRRARFCRDASSFRRRA